MDGKTGLGGFGSLRALGDVSINAVKGTATVENVAPEKSTVLVRAKGGSHTCRTEGSKDMDASGGGGGGNGGFGFVGAAIGTAGSGGGAGGTGGCGGNQWSNSSRSQIHMPGGGGGGGRTGFVASAYGQHETQ